MRLVRLPWLAVFCGAALSFACLVPAEARAHGPIVKVKKVKMKGPKIKVHHHHREHCGHHRRWHGGAWVYEVDGLWYAPAPTGWVVVRF